MKKIHNNKKDRNFWKKLPKPFFALAPMANVTDSVFRRIIAKYGKPDVMWTEFVSADGLVSAGRKRLLVDLEYSNKERPIVAQLFTGHPEVMRKAAEIIAELGFDGLDINMGCPDRAVEKQGGGVAMVKNQELAIEVLNAAREGVSVPRTNPVSLPSFAVSPFRRSAASGETDSRPRDTANIEHAAKSAVFNSMIPVSVKTRLGYSRINLNWIRLLLEQNLPALTIHLRTRKEMSDASAHWEIMPEIIRMRDEISPSTLIIGNGDVETIEDGVSKYEKYGCDGVMIGRGIFGKPRLFSNLNERNPKERLKIMLKHAKLFDETFCGKKHLKNFAVMKKHFKAYVSGWDGAKELRVKLMDTKNSKEVKKVVKEYLSV